MCLRSIEDRRVVVTAVVHVLWIDLSRTISVKNQGKLKWYGGCRYLRDRELGTPTISQQNFAE